MLHTARSARLLNKPVPLDVAVPMLSPQWSTVGGGERPVAAGADAGARKAASRFLLPRPRPAIRHRAVGQSAQTLSAAAGGEEAARESGQKQPAGDQTASELDPATRRQQPRAESALQAHLYLAVSQLHSLVGRLPPTPLSRPTVDSHLLQPPVVPLWLLSVSVAHVRLSAGCPAQQESTFERVLRGNEGDSKRAQLALDHFRFHEAAHGEAGGRFQRLASESRGRRDVHLITNETLQQHN